MVMKTFTIEDWQGKILEEFSQSGVNSSQLVRIGIGLVLNQINAGKKIADLVHECDTQGIPIERGVLTGK